MPGIIAREIHVPKFRRLGSSESWAAAIRPDTVDLSVPEHPVYQKLFKWKPQDFPNAMRIGQQTVSLPLSAKLTDADVDRVVATFQSVLNA